MTDARQLRKLFTLLGFDGPAIERNLVISRIGTLNNSLENLDPPLLLPIAELNIGTSTATAQTLKKNAYQASQSTINILPLVLLMILFISAGPML